ncbi:hypothetical protein PVK06_045421 [Gossypium arboreum]|uniref:Retrotransposon Copia-like N-terminal domain-containing protein n=1 Tax=Gossypium arboreum TaxID=29729 RepID=A0ABR0MWJ9_GOSAR|nr:hypothetical protein PVK06_045421 [Gossypium arboreum]
MRLLIDPKVTNSSSTAIISANINSIHMLNGTNFNEWKRHLLIVFGCMNINIAPREELLIPLIAENTPYVKRDFERWDRSNCISLMITKYNISKAFRGKESKKITKAKVSLTKLRNVLLKMIMLK